MSGPRASQPGPLVVFRAGKGVPAWRERAARSPLPGLWPYGLDLLGNAGAPARTIEVQDLSALGREMVGRWRVGRKSLPGVALAWDELTAVSMAGRLRARAMYSGVIWATDAFVAGRRDASLSRTARALRTMDGLWVLSRPQVAQVREWLGPRCPPVHFLPFGVDADFYAEATFPQQPHVVSVGGDRDRDPETLFRALTLVRAARPDVRFTVQSSSDRPAPDGVVKVSSLPHVQVSSLLASASVVAIATRPNLHASGITVGLEAMSVGRPVVACSTPGMDDYFHDGTTGKLVPTGDPQAMAGAILALLADPAAAARMGHDARQFVLDAHTTATMCAHLTAIAQ